MIEFHENDPVMVYNVNGDGFFVGTVIGVNGDGALVRPRDRVMRQWYPQGFRVAQPDWGRQLRHDPIQPQHDREERENRVLRQAEREAERHGDLAGVRYLGDQPLPSREPEKSLRRLRSVHKAPGDPTF